MRRYTTLPLFLFGGLVLAACGGGEQTETDTAEAETASADALDCYIARGSEEEAQQRPSPLRSVELSVGGNDALLCYGAPSARDREIMGALVPYGEPWRVGANEPTTIHLSGPANIESVALQPGSYSIYAIPGQGEWEFFVNSNWERWGIPIDASVRSTEIGSFTVEPEETGEYVETLQFHFEPSQDGTMGDVVMEWENTRVRFHVHPGM